MELPPPLQAASTESIYSVFGASRTLNVLPDRFRLVASQLGLNPCKFIDGREHFTAADVERIAKIIRHAPPEALSLRRRL